MRPRGRSNSGDDRDLPRIGKQVCCLLSLTFLLLTDCFLCLALCTIQGHILIKVTVAALFLQDNNKGSTRQEFSSFSDVGHAQPAASGAIDLETSFSKGSLGPQSLSPGPEGRSSSIGEVSRMLSLSPALNIV